MQFYLFQSCQSMVNFWNGFLALSPRRSFAKPRPAPKPAIMIIGMKTVGEDILSVKDENWV